MILADRILLPNVEVGRRQFGQPLWSARSGLAVRAQPLVGILIFFPHNSNLFASSCLGLSTGRPLMGCGLVDSLRVEDARPGLRPAG